ncbi:MAG: hypothetical protein SCM96_03980 [Acidobacteriota bacterium]|nr:hypothetical protein [Acidobacteriota bacterium]
MAIVEGRLLPGMGVVQGEAAVGGKRLGERGGRDPGYERQGQGGGAQTYESAPAHRRGDQHFRFILVH